MSIRVDFLDVVFFFHLCKNVAEWTLTLCRVPANYDARIQMHWAAFLLCLRAKMRSIHAFLYIQSHLHTAFIALFVSSCPGCRA